MMKLRRLTRMIGWSALVVLPVAIGAGYSQAMWPYARGFPPTVGPPRWDHMARMVAGGVAVSVVVGALLNQIFTLISPQAPSSGKDAKLPDIGQLWEERDTHQPSSQRIRPAANSILEMPCESQND